MRSFHTRSKFFKKQDTTWLQMVTDAECLGQQPYHSQGPPSVKDVCVKSLFFPNVFLFFVLVGYLALLSVSLHTSSSLTGLFSPLSRSLTTHTHTILVSDILPNPGIHTFVSFLSPSDIHDSDYYHTLYPHLLAIPLPKPSSIYTHFSFFLWTYMAIHTLSYYT
jgi:hypothetical protein